MKELEIYLDYIFIENLFFCILILYEIGIFTKNKIKKTNIIIASIISAFYTTIIFLFQESFLNNIFLKFLIVAITIYISFLPNNFKKYFKFFIYYIGIYTFNVGLIIAITLFFDLNISAEITKYGVYFFSFIFTYLYNKHMWKLWKIKLKESQIYYNITILNKGKKVEFKALLDTGNSLKYGINELDVLVIENSLKERIDENVEDKKKITVNISTANGKSLKNGYIIENVLIQKKDTCFLLKKVAVIFVEEKLSSDNSFQSLISLNTYLENLQGVEL